MELQASRVANLICAANFITILSGKKIMNCGFFIN